MRVRGSSLWAHCPAVSMHALRDSGRLAYSIAKAGGVLYVVNTYVFEISQVRTQI